MDDKKLISLKEAPKLTGYSADYIGQLIRCGKLRGEKVYSQISWMTTKEDILNYKNGLSEQAETGHRQKDLFVPISNYINRLRGEINFIKLFLSHIRSLVPFLVIFLASIIFLSFFVLDSIFNPAIEPIAGKAVFAEEPSGY